MHTLERSSSPPDSMSADEGAVEEEDVEDMIMHKTARCSGCNRCVHTN